MDTNYEKKYKEALERAKTFYKRWDSIEATNSELVLKEVKEIFPELKESEDEMIRKYTIWHLKHTRTYLDNSINNHVDEAIAWLEKQGEKKPIVESTEHSYITPNPEFFQWIYDRLVHVHNENPNVDYMLSLKERIEDMQKSKDNVKPKFKVGDWITNGACIIKITSIDDRYYWHDNDCVGGDIESIDKEYHLWTIKDARDGDVLVSINPFIFKGFEDKMHPNNPTAYCGIHTSNNFIIYNGKEAWTNHEVHPATKKEAGFLFQKMEEAGYEWDAEKKELIKINLTKAEHGKYYYCIKDYFYGGKKIASKGDVVQALRGLPIMGIEDIGEYFLPVNFIKCNSAWNEEDESMLTRCIGILGKCYMKELPNKVEEELIWLKSIKNKIQPNKEWSEEDEEFISILIERINQLYVVSEKLCKYEDRDRLNPKHKDWLIEKIKSLKPYHYWKPSEEQLNEVKNAIGVSGTNGIVLLSLYNNLLKL